MFNDIIITPETHPDHTIVGQHFGGHSHKHNAISIFYCDSHDQRNGFWMTNVFDKTERRAVSEMAIGRSFHPTFDEGDYWHILTWHRLVTKSGEVIGEYGTQSWTDFMESKAAARAAAKTGLDTPSGSGIYAEDAYKVSSFTRGEAIDGPITMYVNKPDGSTRVLTYDDMPEAPAPT